MNWLVALFDFVHLFATVSWIGGIVFVNLVFSPVLANLKELGPAAGRLSAEVGKRFLRAVWGSIVLFFITGIPMTLFNPRFTGFDLSNPWYAAIFGGGAVAATLTIRSMDRIQGALESQPPTEKPGSVQPPPEMMKLVRRQKVIGVTTFILGILTLLLTAIAEAAFIPG